MEFHQRRKPTPSVPILPLIDILTILLIFFVVTTQFKKKKHTLKIEIPQSNGTPLNITVAETSIVAISKTGEYSLNEVNVSKEELLKFLQYHKEDKPNAKFIIEQDKWTPALYLAFARDQIFNAGFKDVHLRLLTADEEQ